MISILNNTLLILLAIKQSNDLILSISGDVVVEVGGIAAVVVAADLFVAEDFSLVVASEGNHEQLD